MDSQDTEKVKKEQKFLDKPQCPCYDIKAVEPKTAGRSRFSGAVNGHDRPAEGRSEETMSGAKALAPHVSA